MVLAVSAAAILAVSSPAFVGSFGGYDQRNDPGTRWERFDLMIENTTEVERSIGLCTSDADMVLLTNQRSARSAFAIKLDDDNWSFGCDEKVVAPGESVKIGLFFRPGFEFGPRRTINVETNVGSFVLNP